MPPRYTSGVVGSNSSDLAPRAASRITGPDRTDVDVVVIGGGVNGTGVARDLALRGLRVALFERNDLAFGASGNSSGMIHGGARYLTSDPAVTEKSCRDSGHIQAIAPHLLFRIPFLVPVSKAKSGAGLWVRLFDGFFEAYDRYQPLKRGKPHVRLSPDELAELEPGLSRDLAGGVAFDEWGIDGARLCVANAVDAEEHGGRIHVACTVERIERDDEGAVRAVRYRDRHSGETGRVTTDVVVNATGAWAPLTASLGGLPAAAARVRPTKGIHIVYDRRLTNYAILAETIDGRQQAFMEPWQNVTVVGTTDDDYYGDLDDVTATSEEVRYLLEAVARVFPSIHRHRAIGTFAGVRPTLYKYGPVEDKLSRDDRVIDHASDGADGLYSMIGGKLASYRLFAQEMADILARRFDLSGSCATHLTPLPGGDEPVDVTAVAREAEIDAVTARRLVYRHGSRAHRITARMTRRPSEARTVCRCEPVLEAEIRYCLEHEHARSVAEISRRTRLGLGPCGGLRCAGRCGQIVAEQLELDPAEAGRQALRFVRRQARQRTVALGPDQARQEALTIAWFRSQLGIGRQAWLDDEGDCPRPTDSQEDPPKDGHGS